MRGKGGGVHLSLEEPVMAPLWLKNQELNPWNGYNRKFHETRVGFPGRLDCNIWVPGNLEP